MMKRFGSAGRFSLDVVAGASILSVAMALTAAAVPFLVVDHVLRRASAPGYAQAARRQF